MLSSLAFISILSLGWGVVRSATSPTVTISAGSIQGTQCSTSNATSFLSIPYAQPPTGDLRLAPPQAYNSSFPGGTIQATTSAPACLQFGDEYIEHTPQSEDWQVLHIVHTASRTMSEYLTVCILTSGYRLPPQIPLHSQSNIEGNFGLQDILLPLSWVQTNIAAFGGDPKSVLLFGQSAGAVDTFFVSSLPQAPSLIRAAIMESGGGRSYGGSAAANTYSAKYASLINCSTSDISCFRSATVTTLNTSVPSGANVATVENGMTYTGWGPHVDGKIVPADPGVVGVQVPAVFGWNTQDGSFFVIEDYRTTFSDLTAANYTEFLQYNFGAAAATVEKFYPLSTFISTPIPVFYAIVYITTAVNFACPAYRGLMNAEKRGIPVWTYQFGHTPSCPWYANMPDTKQALSILGPTHTSEIPFVFANTKDLPLPDGNCTFTSQEQEISAQLVAAWTSMAATANPSSSLLAWPAWNSTSSLGIHVLNSTAAGVVNYTICELWDTIAAEEINGTLVSNTSATNASSTTSGAGSSTGSATTTAATSTSTNAAGGFIVQSSMLLVFVLVGMGALL